MEFGLLISNPPGCCVWYYDCTTIFVKVLSSAMKQLCLEISAEVVAI